jgi:hypothetical protein
LPVILKERHLKNNPAKEAVFFDLPGEFMATELPALDSDAVSAVIN